MSLFGKDDAFHEIEATSTGALLEKIEPGSAIPRVGETIRLRSGLWRVAAVEWRISRMTGCACALLRVDPI